MRRLRQLIKSIREKGGQVICTIEPCNDCISKAIEEEREQSSSNYESGYSEGYGEGFKEGYQSMKEEG